MVGKIEGRILYYGFRDYFVENEKRCGGGCFCFLKT